MSLTLLNRLDIDIDWGFTAISVGFNIHKRGIQLSLIFIDISFFYAGPKWRLKQEERYSAVISRLERTDKGWVATYEDDQA